MSAPTASSKRDGSAGHHASPPDQRRNSASTEPRHRLGSTELRLDKPIPKAVVATPPPMPMGTPKPMPMQPAKPPEKRLTRLEQLRLEQEEREKAAAEFYQAMAELVDDPLARGLFERLASEEMQHKYNVESMYEKAVYKAF